MRYPDPSRFSDDFTNYLKEIAHLEHYKKGKTLLSPSEPNNKSWYIESGIAKIFHHTFDKKHNRIEDILYFVKEQESLNCVDSFFGREPNEYYIELMEDSALYVVTKVGLEEAYALFPEAHEVAREIILSYKQKSDLRAKLLTLPAQVRFGEFSKIFNTNRLSVDELSAYLHISRTHLNRVRSSK